MEAGDTWDDDKEEIQMRVMTWLLVPVFLAGCAAPLGAGRMTQGQAEEIAANVLAMERAALDRWCSGDPSGFLEITAPEVVYFDPEQQRRLDGIQSLTMLYDGIRGKIHVDRYDVIDPDVQVCGTTAVLTYNYVAYVQGQAHRWNCTEVYCRRGDRWWITNTHWSVTQPLRRS